MDTKASSFASPSASVRDGELPDVEYAVDVGNANLLTITFTILAVLIAYDQSMPSTLRDYNDLMLTSAPYYSQVLVEQR